MPNSIFVTNSYGVVGYRRYNISIKTLKKLFVEKSNDKKCGFIMDDFEVAKNTSFIRILLHIVKYKNDNIEIGRCISLNREITFCLKFNK